MNNALSFLQPCAANPDELVVLGIEHLRLSNEPERLQPVFEPGDFPAWLSFGDIDLECLDVWDGVPFKGVYRRVVKNSPT